LSALGEVTVRAEGVEEVLDLPDFERRVEAGEIDLFAEVRFPPLTGDRFVRVGEVESFRRLAKPRGIYFQRAFHFGRIPYLTLAVCLANLLVFFLQRAEGPVTVGTLVSYGAKAGPLIHDLGQLWRLLTANFVHVDAFHIGFNLFVIFHFGAAVENAYRHLDYLLILLASALGTTLASYATTDALTLGASGVAYGLLGSAVVFGLKYARWLPRRYRAVLGAAVLPTVGIFLYMGFTSEGIDNWGHLGGLLAGSAVTLPLTPRLWGATPSLRERIVRRVLPIGAVLAALTLGSLVAAQALPRFREVRDERLGLAFEIPRGWQLQRPGVYDNALPLHIRASFAVAVRAGVSDPDPFEAVRAWSEEELSRQLAEGTLERRVFGAIRPAKIGGMEGASRRLELLVEGVPTVLTAVFAARDDHLYSFISTRPVDLPAYDRVLERIAASIRPLDEEPAEAIPSRGDGSRER